MLNPFLAVDIIRRVFVLVAGEDRRLAIGLVRAKADNREMTMVSVVQNVVQNVVRENGVNKHCIKFSVCKRSLFDERRSVTLRDR